MLLATTTLAARIERAECRLLSDSAAAIARRPDRDAFVQEIAGGVATFTGPDSPLNKLAGLGFGGSVSETELTRIEGAFEERAAPLQAELSTLADTSIGALLTGRGYRLRGFENVLGRSFPVDSSPTSSEVRIELGKPDDLSTWLDVVVTGFASPDLQGVPSHESFPREVLEPILADMASADGFVRYLAHRSGEPAGGASMRVFEGVAQLTGAATVPAHRRHGVQSALLGRRLADATEAGCDVAVVTTQPGSKSQENVQRLGFELLYSRAILVREPGTG